MTGLIFGTSTTSSWISAIVRWFTRSKSSHTWLAYYDLSLQIHLVMEATERGYRLITWQRWAKSNRVVSAYICRQNLTRHVRKIGTQYLGASYDWKSMLWLFLRRWFGKWMTNPEQNVQAVHCSEATTRIMKQAGYMQREDEEWIIPKDLDQFWKNHPDFVSISNVNEYIKNEK